MNRERVLSGVNSYARELGFDPGQFLAARGGGAAWLDLCSGEGLALREAAGRVAGGTFTGVDLVGPMRRAPLPPGLELVTADLADWAPPPGRCYDLITCVHGLHYIGDRLGLLARIATWLTADGLFVAHFDPFTVRVGDDLAVRVGEDGSVRVDEQVTARVDEDEESSAVVLAALREAGFAYSARNHRLTLRGGRPLDLPLRYLGADPEAGPNYTGQPGVAAHYALRGER
ncbi:class I SAM-dependent methyltransferase [Streptomyces sp. TRM66268-LWL]|uniref:Class I SAM-dependent methyltransferase n=2 Tax=Streptomyces polyasparticus TaxID=2767826 RepID=A0ABR7S996_9ACTN|nr:class I SAM-dependent methyltransferase [Streptomyces polyasparticus]